MKVKECVGCGYCCIKSVCLVSASLHKGFRECPELKWNGFRHVCKLMELLGERGERYRKELYAGEGCCSGLNTWRREIKNRIGEINVY